LHSMKGGRADAFDGGDFCFFGQSTQGHLARPDGLAIEVNGTSPTLGHSAAEFGAFQVSKITQSPNQGHIRLRLERDRTIIDSQLKRWHRYRGLNAV
jgi:hypothetical protein